MLSDVVKDGDAINLVSELLNINNYEAAKQINSIFNLGIDFETKISSLELKKYNAKIRLVEQFKEWENETFQFLCDYLHLLWKWEKIADFENDLFVEALQNKDYIQYIIDEYFINGTEEDKIWFYKNKKNTINGIETKIKKIRERRTYGYRII